MGKVIDFKICREKIEKKRVDLSRFNVPDSYVDVESLYRDIDSKFQDDKFLMFQDNEDLFYNLNDVLNRSDKKRSAWVVLDGSMDYLYLKEKGTIYTAVKGQLNWYLRDVINEYAIDYMIIVERVKSGVYRKIVV